jgi:hypothetical protein
MLMLWLRLHAARGQEVTKFLSFNFRNLITKFQLNSAKVAFFRQKGSYAFVSSLCLTIYGIGDIKRPQRNLVSLYI